VELEVWAAANRDERTFPEAYRFEIERPELIMRRLPYDQDNLRRLGARIARMEGPIPIDLP
jgi:cytochrome P450